MVAILQVCGNARVLCCNFGRCEYFLKPRMQ